MLKSIHDFVLLNNGVEMPQLGLGLMAIPDGQQVARTIDYAAEIGYRSFDTATVYQNEKGVGLGIKSCGVPREELFITTKLWNDSQGYENALKAFDNSLKALQLDYIDLYLIHWPLPMQPKYIETWQALEKLYKERKIRAIGVSNFNASQIDEIIEKCQFPPMVNQVEFHPYLNQFELHHAMKSRNVQLEAWSPLSQGEVLNNKVIQEIANKHGKSPAQVVIRWDLQKGVVTIPKSSNFDRIRSNAEVFDFELSEEDMLLIEKQHIGKRNGPHPDEFFAGCKLD